MITARRCLSVAAAATFAFVLAQGMALGQLTDDERKCSDAVNKGGRNVGNQEQKGDRTCVKDGSGDISSCITPETAKAASKRTKVTDLYATGGKCDPLPAFGVNPSGNSVCDGIEAGADGNITGIFGTPPDGVVADDKCADKMAKRSGKKFDTIMKAFRGCAKDLASIPNIAALEGCVATAIADPKVTSAQGKLDGDVANTKACPSIPPAGAEDGKCGSAGTAAAFSACLGANVNCQACLAIRNMIGSTVLNCDMLDNGSADGSCSVCGDNIASGSEQCDGSDTGSCPGGAGCFPPGDPNQCQCAPASCAAIDVNSGGSANSGTFIVQSTGAPQNGAKYCGGESAANAFGPCATDADCGGTAGQCVAIPWLGVSVFAPFPITTVQTTFTAGPPDAKCVHQATVPCTGSTDPCAGTPKLGAGNPCCATPGFHVDTFFIASLGFCSRNDQTACGGGIVDTSVPMLGDNDVTKVADTSTPAGANCTYNGSPSETHAACGASEDALGQIKATIGDGVTDANGGHTRFSIPGRSVTWIETSAPPCGPTDTYDGSDSLISKFNLQLATTTASAKASFQDVNGDGVSYCGFGPAAFNGTGTAQGKPDKPGQGSLTVAIGAALSGGGPTYDLLFSSLTPLTSPVLTGAIPMCSPLPAGCPE